MEKYYTFAKKTETGTYIPVQCVNGDSTQIPVTLDERTSEEKIMHYLVPERRIQLEGVVLEITPYVVRGVIPKDKLKILE